MLFVKFCSCGVAPVFWPIPLMLIVPVPEVGSAPIVPLPP